LAAFWALRPGEAANEVNAMLKDLLDSGEPVATSGLAKLAGLPAGQQKSLPVAMQELTAQQQLEKEMLSRIKSRRRTTFASDQLGDMQQAHKRNKALDAAEAALIGGDYDRPETD
jgi:hypothetical protein